MFNEFKIENQEMVQGGDYLGTTWTDSGGGSGSDVYDTESRRMVYFDKK